MLFFFELGNYVVINVFMVGIYGFVISGWFEIMIIMYVILV